MASSRPTFDQIKRIPIPDYLAKLGFEPAKIRGVDYWYHSPLHPDHTPSFKVNTEKNLWYDHGIGEGGTLIDLGIKLHNCTIREFQNQIFKFEDRWPIIQLSESINNKAQPGTQKVEVLSVSSLESLLLIGYLNDRGIDKTLASEYCLQVEFRIGNRNYSAVGFRNQSGGYELRNNWFKGAASPKDLSIIKNEMDDLCVIEGFIDFLSLQKIDREKKNVIPKNASFLILNSLSLLRRGVDFIKEFKNVHLFLDNDLPAMSAKEILTQADIVFSDASNLYLGFKDINDYLTADLKNDSSIRSGIKKSQRL